MKKGINKVMVMGSLGKDPVIRYSGDGKAMASFSIATSESWKDKVSGEKQERTEWINIAVFGKLAELCGEYLFKGSKVYCEGKLNTRKYKDKEGIDRYSTSVLADEVQFLTPKQEGQAAPARSGSGNPVPASSFVNDFDDDIPF